MSRHLPIKVGPKSPVKEVIIELNNQLALMVQIIDSGIKLGRGSVAGRRILLLDRLFPTQRDRLSSESCK